VQDRGTLRLLWITITISLTACGFLRPQHLAAWHTQAAWWTPACAALLALGLVVRLVAIVSLGKSFTANVTTHADQKLNQSGLFAVVRHPSYLGMEIIFLAIGLATRDWLCLALAVVPTTLALLRRIEVEELALRSAFGGAYDDYCQQTRRLIPGLY
jgi:protein-S-isoprenylcysteine O-methyltransferase Ste14